MTTLNDGTAINSTTTPTDVDIVDAANSPKRMRTDEGSVEERSIDELITAKDYIDADGSLEKNTRGIRMSKIKPGGTV